MNRRTRIKKDQFFPGVDKQVLQVVGKDTMWASLSTAFPDGEDGQIIRRRNGLISWDSFPEASELQNSLNAKADKATTYTKEQVYTKKQTDTKATELAKAEINKLVDGAPAALDTLKEIADKINAGDSVVATLTGKMADLEAGKVDKSELKYLTKEKIVEGTEAVHSLVTASGLKLAHEELSAPIRALAAKNEQKISALEQSSNAATADISNLQSSLQEKADRDHSHSLATQTSNGFMSSADKTKLDNLQQGSGGGGISVYKVTVNEPNNTADKTAEFSGTVQENDIFDVLFVNGHNGAPATLKLGSNPKYTIRSNTGAQLNWASGFLPSGSRVLMIYSNNELKMLSPTHNHSISPMSWQEYSTRSENARSISGKLLWSAVSINKRLRHANPIRINGNCPAGSVIVGSYNGYVKAAPGVSFSNLYPILWNEYEATAGQSTGYSYVYADSVDLSVTLPGYSSPNPRGQTYLVAKRNGNSFVVEPEVFAHDIEEVDNGKIYFAIGLRSDSKTIYFAPSGVYWFKGGKIAPYSPEITKPNLAPELLSELTPALVQLAEIKGTGKSDVLFFHIDNSDGKYQAFKIFVSLRVTAPISEVYLDFGTLAPPDDNRKIYHYITRRAVDGVVKETTDSSAVSFPLLRRSQEAWVSGDMGEITISGRAENTPGDIRVVSKWFSMSAISAGFNGVYSEMFGSCTMPNANDEPTGHYNGRLSIYGPQSAKIHELTRVYVYGIRRGAA